MQVLTDLQCLEHRVPVRFPECPERLSSVLEGLRRDWEVVELTQEPRSGEAAVLAVHDEDYVRRFHQAVERGDGLFDSADNPLGPETWRAAWAAVATTLEAADRVARGRSPKAFAAVRPPGHHAEAGLAMGFCFFNNIAIAAQHLIEEHGVERVAIFDFDVHHGNGTQHIFEHRADVLYVSTHQFPFYPGTGAATETGKGNGTGTTLNLPLAASSGDDAYAEALDEKVLPALRGFEPQVLLLSAGFDAWRGDPLGGMEVTENGFYDWGYRLAELAEETCQGRTLAVLEGGYDLDSLSRLVDSHLRGLAGKPRPGS